MVHAVTDSATNFLYACWFKEGTAGPICSYGADYRLDVADGSYDNQLSTQVWQMQLVRYLRLQAQVVRWLCGILFGCSLYA